MSSEQTIIEEENVSKSRIYTKTGDHGTSKLYNGERRPKSDQVFQALGAIDELNANLGLAREYCRKDNNGIEKHLSEIQSRLIDLMSSVATPRTSSPESKLQRTEFDAQNVRNLEILIDVFDNQLPKLTQFILPSGGLASCQLHIARTVCRRAEREIASLLIDGDIEPIVGQYLNRLSARKAVYHIEEEEVAYKKGQGLQVMSPEKKKNPNN